MIPADCPIKLLTDAMATRPVDVRDLTERMQTFRQKAARFRRTAAKAADDGRRASAAIIEGAAGRLDKLADDLVVQIAQATGRTLATDLLEDR